MLLTNCCELLLCGDWRHILFDWRRHLGEEYEPLERFLMPTDKVSKKYPATDDSYGCEVQVHEEDGRYIGTVPGSRYRVELKPSDVLVHQFDIWRLRKEMCDGFGMVPQTGEIMRWDHTVPWGNLELEKGITVPITLYLGGDYLRSFRERVMDQIFEREAVGEIVFTPNRFEWDGKIEERARKYKILLVPFDEVVQFKDGKFLPTPQWDEFMIAFYQMVEMDLPSKYQKAKPEFMLAKRGAWVFRFGNKETIAEADWPGPAFVQYLLQNPGVEFHVEKLWQTVMGTPSGTRFEHAFADEGTDIPESLLGGADDILDAEAKNAYEKRLKELIVERREAESDKDEAALERIESEFETIRAALESSGGGMHSPKKLGDPVVRLRDRIRWGINVFIDHVSNHDPEAGQYLRNTIKRGTFMQYSPIQNLDWNLS